MQSADRVPERLLSREEVQTVLGVSPRTFFRVVRPTIPVVRIGWRLGIRPADLDRWIAERTAQRAA